MLKKNMLKQDVGAILVMGAIAAVGYSLSPLLLPKAETTLPTPSGCDLQRNRCTAAMPDGGTLEFLISPRPIPMVAPLRIEVAVTGSAARKVEVDFAGVGMNMGLNRPLLEPAAPGRFVGTTTLPVCVTGSMAWRATVLVETDGARIAIPFTFEVGQR